MASTPRRQWSRDSSLMNKLNKAATSFIQQFNTREHRMRHIVKELQKISKKAETMQGTTGNFKLAAAVGAGLGLAFLAAPFTKGLSVAAAGALALAVVAVSAPAVSRAATAAVGVVAAAGGIVAAFGGGFAVFGGVVAAVCGVLALFGGICSAAAVDEPAVAAAGETVASYGGIFALYGGIRAAVAVDGPAVAGGTVGSFGGICSAAAVVAAGGTVAAFGGIVAAFGGVLAAAGGAVAAGVGGGVVAVLGAGLAALGGGVVVGAVAAADGAVRGVVGGVVVGSIITTMWSESAKKVEKLGKEFIGIAEALKRTLEEIQETCEKLEIEAAEAQYGNTRTTEEFEMILRQVSGLKEVVSESLPKVTSNLLTFTVSVLKLTETPEEDRKIRYAIIQSADHSQNVTNEFKKTQTHLKMLNLYGWNFTTGWF
ncbi:uncharacterized protein LOC110969514 [Acanthochromis polyacanthus]|uniref:uncharacterized protein LOC110969514 n=1 Tax=Acanthochromis polyacanthus TaxID=80966 RepID=UPI000B90734E|nr:uncharacterized protein LOC110969514 [Acanthochromis polyacanthus]XP_022075287.1 uncharacterized protein LOC110969514 [Acanthochromis polyacanthus]